MANKTPHVTKILFDILAGRAQKIQKPGLTGWLSVRGVSQRLEIKGLKFFQSGDHSLLP
jgi:hypothetical protein